MSKIRITADDYRALASRRGIEWLADEIAAYSVLKTTWRCCNGHIFTTSYTSINSGSGCPVCAINKTRHPKHGLVDYHDLAKKRDFVWLGSTVPPTTNHPTLWRCNLGHEWTTSYGHIRGGKGCPHCAGVARLTPENYHDLAQARGFQWVEESTTPSALQKTNWICSQGHTWASRYNNIKNSDSGCPFCAGKSPHTTADYHDLAIQHSFQWVSSKLPKTAQAKTTWRCSVGHEWESPYSAIRHGKHCPVCSGHARKTAGDYADLATMRGLFWIGQFPENTVTKTYWQCQRGHVLKSSYNSIAHNSGRCPQCKDYVNGKLVSTQQRNIHKALGGVLNYPVPPYFVDIAIEVGGIKIGVEYDCQKWHDLVYDAKRDTFLVSLGWSMLHVRSNKSLPSRAQLDTAINELVAGATYTEIVLDDWRS